MRCIASRARLLVALLPRQSSGRDPRREIAKNQKETREDGAVADDAVKEAGRAERAVPCRGRQQADRSVVDVDSPAPGGGRRLKTDAPKQDEAAVTRP